MALMSSSFSYLRRSLVIFSESTPFSRSPMVPRASTMPTRAPEVLSTSPRLMDDVLFTAEYASSMKPKSTRKRPPKITASTTAARLSTRRLLPLAPSRYKRVVPFRRMLGSLLERTKGARGAVFCDFEGEFVELVIADPAISDYDMKICGAQV